jgi:hypothetical protein
MFMAVSLDLEKWEKCVILLARGKNLEDFIEKVSKRMNFLMTWKFVFPVLIKTLNGLFQLKNF